MPQLRGNEPILGLNSIIMTKKEILIPWSKWASL
jgi:hypothetical protein